MSPDYAVKSDPARGRPSMLTTVKSRWSVLVVAIGGVMAAAAINAGTMIKASVAINASL